MAKSSLGPVLQHIQQMAASAQANGMDDSELLRRFIDQRDETAFAAIVRRHGGLVFGICRQVLKHEQDAEDAFQATFLALAQGVASVRRSESLPSWLHGTAYRMAMRAKRDLARRSVHERRATPSEPQEEDTEVSWREVLTALHEEIQRLAEKYRSPFVLHYLESKSCPEVATALGLKEGTVWSRLAKARALLQGRLSRRGLELTGVLASMVVTWQEAAAVPPLLIVTTARVGVSFAAGGSVAGATANALSLATGATKTMMLTKTKITTAVFLAMGAVAVGASLVANPPTTKEGGEPKQVASAGASDGVQVRPEGTHMAVKGRVLDPDGRPVAGAKLYLGHYGPEDRVTVSEKAKSDANGRFQFAFPKTQLSKAKVLWKDPWEDPWEDPSELMTWMHFRGGDRIGQIMAVAAGLGCNWVRLEPKAATHELTLRLVKDNAPISGRIVDSEGKPVAGARLRVVNIQAGGDLKETLEALRDRYHKKPATDQAPPTPKEWKDWSGPVPGQAPVVTTGADGRFHLSGFGGERLVIFQVEGPGIATDYFRVMTRVGDPVVRPEYKGKIPGWHVIENGRPSETVTAPAETVCYGATFRYLAAASRPIRGVVTDKKTGKPVANVQVGAFGTKEDGLPRFVSVPEETMHARTDREGRYELRGIHKSPSYVCFVKAADRGHYFDMQFRVEGTAGLEPMTVNIEMHPGIVTRGTVRDERTGKPVPGARVSYSPLFPNPATNQLQGVEFFRDRMTGADGSFTVPVLPGPGVLSVRAPDELPPISTDRLYARIPITSQELKDFSKKHNLVLGGPAGSGMETNEKFLIIAHGGQGMSHMSQNRYHRLVLLNPGEKDTELKQDLALRPKEEEKTKGDAKKDKEP